MAEFMAADFKSISELTRGGITSVAVAIGVFDGVHRGHQKVLSELLAVAGELQTTPVVMTFYPHPRSLLTSNPPSLLYPPEEKIRLLYRYGARAVVSVNFTKEFSRLSPVRFLEHSIFSGPIPVLGICVGSQWHFGAKAAGNAAFLQTTAEEKHFQFQAVEELRLDNGNTVSSTLIRKAICEGNLKEAGEMLGRRYALYGCIERGYRMAGAELNAPTANLKCEYGVLPPFGVYAAFATLNQDREKRPAIVNIGVSPTFQERYGRIAPRVEVHLLQTIRESLYGQHMELELVDFVRPEQKFPSEDALKQQIAADIAAAHKILERNC